MVSQSPQRSQFYHVETVHVTIEASGSVLVDKELSESQEITILENLAIADVTLNQLDGAIGIQVRYNYSLL